jgi:hypothetical protein
VRSPRPGFPVYGECRYYRALGPAGRVSVVRSDAKRRRTGGVWATVSAGNFPISVLKDMRPVRQPSETGSIRDVGGSPYFTRAKTRAAIYLIGDRVSVSTGSIATGGGRFGRPEAQDSSGTIVMREHGQYLSRDESNKDPIWVFYCNTRIWDGLTGIERFCRPRSLPVVDALEMIALSRSSVRRSKCCWKAPTAPDAVHHAGGLDPHGPPQRMALWRIAPAVHSVSQRSQASAISRFQAPLYGWQRS